MVHILIKLGYRVSSGNFMNKFRVQLWMVVVSSFFCVPSVVRAKKTIADAPGVLNQSLVGTGVSQGDIASTVGVIIQGVLTASGLVFFGLIFYGGFTWLLARGNEEHIATAKKTIIAAVIGLIVVVSSYAITNFITSRFTG